MSLNTADNRPAPTMQGFPHYGEAAMEHPFPADAIRPFSRVGILGAGEAGMGIAKGLLEADIPVTVYELERERLDQATAAVRQEYQDAVSDGELAAAQRDRRIALLVATINLHHLKDCDVIVDALPTSSDVRDALLRRLKEVARPGAILIACTDTETELERTAALMRFPENVVGMRLSDSAGAGQWELVAARATSGQTLATATRITRSLGLSPVAALPPVLW